MKPIEDEHHNIHSSLKRKLLVTIFSIHIKPVRNRKRPHRPKGTGFVSPANTPARNEWRKEPNFPALLRSIHRSNEFHKVGARTVDAFDPGGLTSLTSFFKGLPICMRLLAPQLHFTESRRTRADDEERSEGAAATGE